MGSFITEGDAGVVLRKMERLVLVEHPVFWDFSEVPDMFVGWSADLRQLGAMLDGWGDTVDAETKALGGNDEPVVEVPAEPRELTETERP